MNNDANTNKGIFLNLPQNVLLSDLIKLQVIKQRFF